MLPYWDWTYIWETVKLKSLIVSIFTRLISCWKTPQKAGNSLSELQEIQNLLRGGIPPDTPRGSHLSQLRPDLLPYDVYVLVKPCIYILVAAVIQTCRLELLHAGPPLNMSAPVTHP
jgi:hypothetical protein